MKKEAKTFSHEALSGCGHIVDQRQYAGLMTSPIAAAVVATLIAQRWFHPGLPEPGGAVGRSRWTGAAQCDCHTGPEHGQGKQPWLADNRHPHLRPLPIMRKADHHVAERRGPADGSTPAVGVEIKHIIVAAGFVHTHQGRKRNAGKHMCPGHAFWLRPGWSTKRTARTPP